MRAAPSRRGPGSLRERLGFDLAAKLAVWIGLALGICIPYFGLQQLDWTAPALPDPTPIDLAVSFAPGWIWAYASLALLVPLAPLLAPSREALRRYATGLALLCVASFVVFALVPVAGPRPEVAPEATLYGWIVSVDRPTNSLPSLHAGLTAYSLLYVDRVFAASLPRPGRLAVRCMSIAWAGLILYSTLATKQHWLIDLPPGLALAWLADRVAWRGAPHRGPTA